MKTYWHNRGCSSGIGQNRFPCAQTEALIVLIVNIMAPGIGTMLAACFGSCKISTLLVGIVQLLTAPLLIGWIWAIVWSIKLRKLAKQQHSHITREDREERFQHMEDAYQPPPPVANPWFIFFTLQCSLTYLLCYTSYLYALHDTICTLNHAVCLRLSWYTPL